MPSMTMTDERRAARQGTVAAMLVVAVVVGLLLAPLPDSVRHPIAAAALMAAGVFATLSTLLRARRESRSRRRPWLLLTAAGVVALVDYAGAALAGRTPATEPGHPIDLVLLLGLVLTIGAVLSFPSPRRSGSDLLMLMLDGAIASVALFVATAPLIVAPPAGAEVDPVVALTDLTTPALAIVLVTLALLLLPHARSGQRPMFALLAAGFTCYTATTLLVASRFAAEARAADVPLELGWVLGLLLVGLAAWRPAPGQRAGRRTGSPLPEAPATSAVFGVVVLATVVQTVLVDPAATGRLDPLVWILLLVAAGGRLLLLALENASLRRGLERRVAAQVADLRGMVRQREALLSSVGEGIYGVDAAGRVTFVNPAGAQMLGWPADELVGEFSHDLFHEPDVGDQSHAWVDCTVHQAITQARVSTRDEVYRRADGSTFDVESTVSPLSDASGRGAVIVFRNVTERREVERMKNEFLSVVSHELRTPLTAILASLEMISDGSLGDLPPDARPMVRVAQNSSERLARLINDLLDAERIQSGDTPLAVRPLPVERLLTSAALQMYGVAAQAEVEIVIGKAEGVVMADEDRAMQTLVNLLGNAVKFSAPGQQVVVEGRQRGRMVRFDVRDNGRGIPEDKLESIFERFAQVDSSDARDLGGTGLGLAICRTIVARHGGTITAASRLGQGTTVSFTLPSAGPSERDQLDPSVTAAPARPPLAAADARGPVPSAPLQETR